MQNLLDPKGSYIKSEKNVKKFLKSLPDESIRNFYENIELTPFPILLAKEYHQRLLNKKNRSNKNSRTKKSQKQNDRPFRHGSGVKISKIRRRI